MMSAGAVWEARQAPQGQAGWESCQRRAQLRTTWPPCRYAPHAVLGGIQRAPQQLQHRWGGRRELVGLILTALSPAFPCPHIDTLPGTGSAGAGGGSGCH